jgi:death on curing protein
MNEPCWLTLDDVCDMHQVIIAETGGEGGVLDLNALDSTLSKPKNLYFYEESGRTLYDLAACYAYGLVKNHCFIDGNKRVALLATYTFLEIHGIELIASQDDAASLFIGLAESFETQEVARERVKNWIQNNSQDISGAELGY